MSGAVNKQEKNPPPLPSPTVAAPDRPADSTPAYDAKTGWISHLGIWWRPVEQKHLVSHLRDKIEDRIVDLFLADRAADSPGSRIPRSILYYSYIDWCASNGHTVPLSKRRLGTVLNAKGYGSTKAGGVTYRTGLTLRQTDSIPPSCYGDDVDSTGTMDIVGSFLADRTFDAADGRIPVRTLYDVYRDWCASNGHTGPLSKRRLGMTLNQTGRYGMVKAGGVAYRLGLALKSNGTTAADAAAVASDVARQRRRESSVG